MGCQRVLTDFWANTTQPSEPTYVPRIPQRVKKKTASSVRVQRWKEDRQKTISTNNGQIGITTPQHARCTKKDMEGWEIPQTLKKKDVSGS